MRTADSTADCGHANKKIPYVPAFSTLVENADTLENAQENVQKRQNKKIPCMSAFSTLVENAAGTLENAQKMRKNIRIRKFLTCPHFLL